MRCNYSCLGCYSRGRSTQNELSTAEIDTLFTQAEEIGVAFVVITGGEPLMRDDILELVAGHQQLLFALVTNGTFVTQEAAGRIVRSGNVVPLVSLEGFRDHTDMRRCPHAYATAIRALEYLRDSGAMFGFSAMTTARNVHDLVTEEFVDQMVKVGCAIGFFTEYVPCDESPRLDWVLDESTRGLIRKQVLDLRRSKPIVLRQFPHDEYREANHCAGAGMKTLHINAQGDVEPCAVISASVENVREGGLIAACQSPFLRAIRERPTLLQRHQHCCPLFENRVEILQLMEQFRVNRTDDFARVARCSFH